jgi:starvation-inducible DNA-binding protein
MSMADGPVAVVRHARWGLTDARGGEMMSTMAGGDAGPAVQRLRRRRANGNSGETEMSTVQEIAIDIGIEPADRQETACGLERLLADSSTLSLKTQDLHWNVTGPMVRTVHVMFDEHDVELAIELIAERIRALGGFARASFAASLRPGSVVESESVPSADGMIPRLRAGHEQVARTARGVFATADAATDQSTADLQTQRPELHETAAWSLIEAPV